METPETPELHWTDLSGATPSYRGTPKHPADGSEEDYVVCEFEPEEFWRLSVGIWRWWDSGEEVKIEARRYLDGRVYTAERARAVCEAWYRELLGVLDVPPVT